MSVPTGQGGGGGGGGGVHRRPSVVQPHGSQFNWGPSNVKHFGPKGGGVGPGEGGSARAVAPPSIKAPTATNIAAGFLIATHKATIASLRPARSRYEILVAPPC